MTKQLQALLMIAEHPLMRPVLLPAIDVKRESFPISRINYGALSGGEKALLSWAWCVWKDEQVPVDGGPDAHDANDAHDSNDAFNLSDGARDPFESFGVLTRDLQVLVVKSLLHRWS